MFALSKVPQGQHSLEICLDRAGWQQAETRLQPLTMQKSGKRGRLWGSLPPHTHYVLLVPPTPHFLPQTLSAQTSRDLGFPCLMEKEEEF